MHRGLPCIQYSCLPFLTCPQTFVFAVVVVEHPGWGSSSCVLRPYPFHWKYHPVEALVGVESHLVEVEHHLYLPLVPFHHWMAHQDRKQCLHWFPLIQSDHLSRRFLWSRFPYHHPALQSRFPYRQPICRRFLFHP